MYNEIAFQIWSLEVFDVNKVETWAENDLNVEIRKKFVIHTMEIMNTQVTTKHLWNQCSWQNIQVSKLLHVCFLGKVKGKSTEASGERIWHYSLHPLVFYKHHWTILDHLSNSSQSLKMNLDFTCDSIVSKL